MWFPATKISIRGTKNKSVLSFSHTIPHISFSLFLSYSLPASLYMYLLFLFFFNFPCYISVSPSPVYFLSMCFLLFYRPNMDKTGQVNKSGSSIVKHALNPEKTFMQVHYLKVRGRCSRAQAKNCINIYD